MSTCYCGCLLTIVSQQLNTNHGQPAVGRHLVPCSVHRACSLVLCMHVLLWYWAGRQAGAAGGMVDLELAKLMSEDDLGASPAELIRNLR